MTRPLPPVSGVFQAQYFFQVSSVIFLSAGKWNSRSYVWLFLSQVSLMLVSSETQAINSCSSDLLQKSVCSEFCWPYVRNPGKQMFPCWGARPLRLICLHFVSVYPSPSAVMGEIIEPTPPPMLIWALFRVEISLSCTGRHSRKLKTLHKEGTSGERCKCKIDT